MDIRTTISQEWSQEERLQVIKDIALCLQNNIATCSRSQVYQTMETIYLLTSQTKYFLENNRDSILYATQFA